MAKANRRAAPAPARPAAPQTVETAPPAAAGPGLSIELLTAFLPAEVKPLLALFDDKFELYEVWDALEAAGRLGRKAEMFLEGSGPVFGSTAGPAVRGVVPAATLATSELAAQLEEAVGEARPLTLAGTDRGGVPDGAIGMNPIIAGLLISLAKKAVEMLLARLAGR